MRSAPPFFFFFYFECCGCSGELSDLRHLFSPFVLTIILCYLGTLTNAQLINLVNTLVDSHPSLAEDISNLVPRPTVASVQPYLAALETKMQESFPYTKWGPSYDDYSFNRVKPALDELVVSKS